MPDTVSMNSFGGAFQAMARPVSVQRRQELALAAFEAIRVRGVYGITMSELAELLGMKRPTLYWYFRDVGHVFETVLEHMLDRQRTFLEARMAELAAPAGPAHAVQPARPSRPPPPPHPIDLLRAYADAIWAFFEKEGPLVLSLVSFWGQSEGSEPTRVLEVVNRRFLPLVTFAVASLEDGIRRGTVAPCDPRAVVDLVAAVIDGSLVHRVTRGISFQPVGKLLWDSVLAPLKRVPEAPPGQPDDAATPAVTGGTPS